MLSSSKPIAALFASSIAAAAPRALSSTFPIPAPRPPAELAAAPMFLAAVETEELLPVNALKNPTTACVACVSQLTTVVSMGTITSSAGLSASNNAALKLLRAVSRGVITAPVRARELSTFA